MKYSCQKWVIDTVFCNCCFKYWTIYLESGLKFRNANTKMFLLCLKSTEAFEVYVVHPSMQSHAALLMILFTAVHSLCPSENALGREGGERLKDSCICRGLKDRGCLNWCFQLWNWCDSFSVPLMIFYVVGLVKYLQTAPPPFNIWQVRC